MSIPINIEKLSNADITAVNSVLIFNIMTPKIARLVTYEVVDTVVYLPFSFGRKNGWKGKSTKDYVRIEVGFSGKLRAEQIVVKKDTIDSLSSLGSCILSLPTGGGKTITAINIACCIKLRTLIIVNKIVILQQWIDSINRFCPSAKIFILKPSEKYLESEADFYIVNAINIPKFNRLFLSSIGFVIVDECHNILSQVLSRGLLHLQPRYLLGLSATPYRLDDCQKLITLYFGDRYISRKLQREFEIYIVKTKFEPEIRKAANGRLDWGIVLKSLSAIPQRNELIVDIIVSESERNFLVLSKRVDQVKSIVKLLKEKKVHVTSMTGGEQKYDENARVLVATLQKCSTGFDGVRFDTLLLATDTSAFFEQTLGRIFRRINSSPRVYDIVDNHPVLHKHFKQRCEVYKKVGGTFYNY